jgi:hypothetical protein
MRAFRWALVALAASIAMFQSKFWYRQSLVRVQHLCTDIHKLISFVLSQA